MERLPEGTGPVRLLDLFVINHDQSVVFYPSEGLVRVAAAVHLRVPDSGLPWLDEMIRKARRDDFAKAALASEWAYDDGDDDDGDVERSPGVDVTTADMLIAELDAPVAPLAGPEPSAEVE